MIARNRSGIRLVIFVGMLALFVALVSSAPFAAASPARLPPRPTPATPTPTPAPLPRVRDGGLIQLVVPSAQSGLWTLVQWQDARGGWHDVTGWQGTLDGDSQMWWVAEADLGKGPFRWRVYRGKGGALLGQSTPFDLPADIGKVVRVEVSIGP